jgi:drug/metabolite transporter (DMT)-like permease
VLPALPNVLMQSTWAAAFYYIDPAFLVLLSNTSILWIAAFSLIFFAEERPLIKSRRFWSAMILSMAGLVGVVYFKEDFSTRGRVMGIILALTGGFAWGVYTICAKVAFRDIDVREGFAVMSLYTTIVLWIFTMVFGRPVGALEIGYQPWLAVIISAIMGISLAHVLYYWAIKRIGATIPMLVVLAQPFLVFLVSRVIFGESLNILQLICGLVLLSGAAIAVWAQEHLKTSD